MDTRGGRFRAGTGRGPSPAAAAARAWPGSRRVRPLAVGGIRAEAGLADALAGADLVVAGSGLFGLTVAERVAAGLGRRVVVLERRDHLGGNAYSEPDPETGIEVHRYGTHVFHTGNAAVWAYVNRFTAFTGYRHRVFSVAGSRVYPMPINLGTLCQFFGRTLTPDQARELVRAQAGPDPAAATNLEDKAVALVGRPLYDTLIRGYTAKQWQTDPRTLRPEVIGRLPVRFSFQDAYFDDPHQGLPVDGYTAWLRRMAEHPCIDVRLGVDYLSVRRLVPAGTPTVYTGPLDRYFGDRAGPLAWRTVDLEREVAPTGDYQGTAVLNYADPDVPWTRVHEFRHLHPERAYPPDRTVLAREFSRAAGPGDEPYYPVDSATDRDRLRRYRELADAEPDVLFGGRLGTYRYLDMHMAIASALQLVDSVLVPHFTAGMRLADRHRRR
jgi:UDP-galactopyranose mutase